MVSLPSKSEAWIGLKEFIVWLIDTILSAYRYLASALVGSLAGGLASVGSVDSKYIFALAFLSFVLAVGEKEIEVIHPKTYSEDTDKKLDRIESKIDRISDEKDSNCQN